MVNPTSLRNDVNGIINENGVTCRFRYFTPTFPGSMSYDEYSNLAQSGNDVWTSGLPQPVKSKWGSEEARLLETGRITTKDKRLYVYGSINVSGTLKIQLGSPTGDQYETVNDVGVQDWPINNVSVYKKCFIRYLPTGSIYGE